VIAEYCSQWENGYILRIGIDDFKDINERMGMEYGDYVLRGIASCISSSLLPGQNAYRVPSDEFMILDFINGNEEDALSLYHRIRREVDNFVAKNRYEAVYTISGGIVTCSSIANPDYQEIMKISQFALSEAKKRGKNQAYVFRNEDYDGFLRARDIRRALRKSVENDYADFQLFFQPIMYADTGELYAAESLLRFTMPDGQMVSPVEFIPILEDTGLIIPVGKWILKKAIEMCKTVRQVYPNFRVSVNLSYIQILKSSITDEIYQQVDESGLDPESMIMELTESGHLENTPAVKRVWTHLKDYGVSIALDDFGTGYSNLQSIGNLTPNVVKLDRGFTVKALKNEYENLVMRYVIEMAHSLQLKICVEGIETQEELDRVRLLAPDYIQGYYYGKPCCKEEFLQKFVYVA
jgi:diguanylate cyclase (GGDEF)-like protein